MAEPNAGYAPLMEAAGIALAAGDRGKAEVSLRAAIDCVASAEGAGDELYVALVKLASLKQESANYAEAGEIFGRALQVGERTHGPNSLAVVPALKGLGTALSLRGRAAAAAPLLNRALTISESQLGEAHPDLVILLNDLSRLYLTQSAYAYAEPLLTRLLAIKRARGEDRPEVATILASLGSVYQGLGRYESAEQTWRQVVAIRERALAPNHFSIATALEHLAETCAARGKSREALSCLQRAYTIRELGLGGDHASLSALRERISELQLQAAEDSMDSAPAMNVSTSAASMPVATLSAKPQPTLRYEMEPVSKPLRKTIPRLTSVPKPHKVVAAFFGSAGTYLTKHRVAASSVALALLALPLISWGVAGAARGYGRASLPSAPSQRSARRDSASIPATVRVAARDTTRSAAPVLFNRPLATVRVSESRGEAQPAQDTPASRPISVPVIAQAAISQQGLSRIDSVVGVGIGDPRALTAEALRDQLSSAPDVPASSATAVAVRAQLIGAMPAPAYPSTLRASGIKGRVVVRFDVDTTGRPVMRSFTVVESPHAALTEAVRKVIADLRFDPARAGLTYTPTTDNVELRFAFTKP